MNFSLKKKKKVKYELYDMMHIFILGIYSIILPSIKNSNKSIPLWYGKII